MTSNAIDQWIARIRRKTRKAGGHDPIETRRGIGYRFREAQRRMSAFSAVKRLLFASLRARVTLAILMVAIPALAIVGSMAYRQAKHAGQRQLDTTFVGSGKVCHRPTGRNWLRSQIQRGE